MKIYNRLNEYITDLYNYKDLKIEQEINITDMITFKVANRYGKYFQEEGYIKIKEGNFVIKEINFNNEGYEIIAKYNLEDLLLEIEPKAYITKTAEFMLTDLLTPFGWSVINNTLINKSLSVTGSDITALELVYKILDTFNYEFTFDNVTKTVTIAEEMGSDKGAYFHNELNLKSVSKKSDTYDLITRLIPKGYDELGIETVNNGISYIENFQYTDKIITGFWSDERYTIKENLKSDAIKRLEKFSKPMRSYEINISNLSKNPKYKFLEFDKGDTITIINNIDKIKETQRVIKKVIYPAAPFKDTVVIENRARYLNEDQDKSINDLKSSFKKTRADIKLLDDKIINIVSDIEVEVERVISELDLDSIIISDTEPIDPKIGAIWLLDTTLFKWDGLVWVEIGQSQEVIFDRIAETETRIEQTNEAIKETISKNEYLEYKDNTNQLIEDTRLELIKTVNDMNLYISKTVGSNKIKNSVGLSNKYVIDDVSGLEVLNIDHWNLSGYVNTIQNQDLETLGSGSAFIINGSIDQDISLEANKDYTVSCKCKCNVSGYNGKLMIAVGDFINNDLVLNKSQNYDIIKDLDYVTFSLNFKALSNKINLKISNVTNYELSITNLLLNEGSSIHLWSPYNKELYTTNFRSDSSGFTVNQMEEGRIVGYTEMTPTEFAGYYGNDKVFKMNKDIFEMNSAKVDTEIQIGSFRFINNGDSLAIVKADI